MRFKPSYRRTYRRTWACASHKQAVALAEWLRKHVPGTSIDWLHPSAFGGFSVDLLTEHQARLLCYDRAAKRFFEAAERQREAR